ncbi:MAG: sugar O-acetyltransferase [Janibacter sp.]
MSVDHTAEDPRTHRERMLAGDPYIADDPELAALSSRARRLQDRYHRASVAEDPGARDILGDLLGRMGEEVEIRPPLFVDYGVHLLVGARTFVNYNLVALDCARITIGEDCQIGPNVQLLTATHPLEPGPRRDKVESAEPITLGDNVWLGGGVVICPGVTIGDDSVIGAGAVVTKDVPAGVLAVGNPAAVLRRL